MKQTKKPQHFQSKSNKHTRRKTEISLSIYLSLSLSLSLFLSVTQLRPVHTEALTLLFSVLQMFLHSMIFRSCQKDTPQWFGNPHPARALILRVRLVHRSIKFDNCIAWQNPVYSYFPPQIIFFSCLFSFHVTIHKGKNNRKYGWKQLAKFRLKRWMETQRTCQIPDEMCKRASDPLRLLLKDRCICPKTTHHFGRVRSLCRW